jgi:ribosomal protein S18 acetylase RimI-like enzyme
MEVREHTGPDEGHQLARTLGSAFVDDPLFLFTHGGPRPDIMQRNTAFFRAALGVELSKPPGRTVTHVSADGGCVAVWHEVGQWKSTAGEAARLLPGCVRAFGLRRLWGVMKFMKAVERKHPDGPPHVHLQFLGTAAGSQGRGLGSAVISKMLARCDDQGLDAYLESSNVKNVPFYERHGFEILEQPMAGLPAGAPPMTAMWRKPRPAAGREVKAVVDDASQ